MKITKLFPVALAVVALASCSSDDVLNSNNWENELASAKSKLSVTVEELDPVTRASFAEINSKNRTLVWQKGDVIRMLDSKGGSWNLYEYNGNEVAQAVDFKAQEPFNEDVTPTYGLYPNDDIVLSGYVTSNITPQAYMEIPTMLKYGDPMTTSIDGLPAYLAHLPLWGPTKAESTKENPVVGFYYLTAMIRVEMENLTDQQNYLAVVAPNGEALSGTFLAELDLGDPSTTVLSYVEDDKYCKNTAKNYIIADLTELKDAKKRDGVVYLPIPAGTYQQLKIYTCSEEPASLDEIKAGKLIKTVGGSESDVASIPGNVTMGRKTVGNFLASNEFVIDEDINCLSGINTLLSTYTKDIHLQVNNTVNISTDDYKLIIPSSLSKHNVTVELLNGWDEYSSGNIVVEGSPLSLTIINHPEAGTNSVSVQTRNGADYTASVILVGGYKNLTVGAEGYGDGLVSIGDGAEPTADGFVQTSVSGDVFAKNGKLYVAKNAFATTIRPSDAATEVAVAGTVSYIVSTDNSKCNTIVNETGHISQYIENNGTGSITFVSRAEASANNDAIEGAITNGENGGAILIGENVRANKIDNNSTEGTVTVLGSVGAVNSANTVTVGKTDVVGTVRGKLTLTGGNAEIVNGVAIRGIENQGTGNVKIDLLSGNITEGGIHNTNKDASSSITITDGNQMYVTGNIEVAGTGAITINKLQAIGDGISATTGAIDITGASTTLLTTVSGNITNTTGTITLTNVTSSNEVTSEEGNIVLKQATSVKGTDAKVATAGKVTIDCKDQRFSKVSFGTGLDLQNGVLGNIFYTGKEELTVSTAGKSAIMNVLQGADLLSFDSEWTGEAVNGASCINDKGEIYTAAQLAGIAQATASSFSLKTTVKATAANVWPKVALTGSFDGEGNEINIAALDVTADNVGFFSTVDKSATIKISNVNLTVGDIEATNAHNVGALIGSVEKAKSVTITNTTVKAGTITGQYNLGGIIGAVNGCDVTFGADEQKEQAVSVDMAGFDVTLEGGTDVSALYGTVGMFIGTMTGTEAQSTVTVYHGCSYVKDMITGNKKQLGFMNNIIRAQGDVEAKYFWGGNSWIGYCTGLKEIKGENPTTNDKFGSLAFNDFYIATEWID